MQLIDSLIKPIVEWGIREELLHGDHTGQNLWEPGDTATAQVYAKQSGIVAGLPVASMTWKLLDPDCDVESLTNDGAPCEPGDILMRIKSIIISIILFLTLTSNVMALVIGSDDEEILIDANFAKSF